MPNTDLTIRTMTCAELETAVEWAALEGWNPGLHDARCYFAADPTGYFIGFLDGDPVGAVSAVRYGDKFGFMGFFIVKPEHRGQGYGMQLGRAGIEYLEGRIIGLDGVVEQQENYKKAGFEYAFRNVRYQGNGGGEAPATDNLVELSDVPFETIADYEQPFFPTDRSEFLKAWLSQPNAHCLGIMVDGKLSGYAVMRPCRSGYKIGPLYADQPELAEQLFSALKARAKPSDPVVLDVPEVNPEAVALVKRHGMTLVFETARMYMGGMFDLPLDRIFGLTSFEIG